jgi:hypothetical protein
MAGDGTLNANDPVGPPIDAPDPDALTTATVGIAGTILVIVVVLFVQGLYENVNRAEFNRKVVAQAPEELRNLRAAQLASLQRTGWVDKPNGYVAIPIDKAMQLLVADPSLAAPIVLPEPNAKAPAP